MTSSALPKQTLSIKHELATHDASTQCGSVTSVWGKDTEHKRHKGQQTHGQTQVSHAVLALRLGQPVGERRLQAHEQHAGGEGHSCTHIMQHLSVVHLQRQT